MWKARGKFDSINICKLGDYIDRRINQKNFDDCQIRHKVKLASVKPVKKPKPIGELVYLDAIPDEEWLLGKPDLSKNKTLVFFSNKPERIIKCGRLANKENVSFAGLTQNPRLLKDVKKKDKNINVASGKETYINSLDLWDGLVKKNKIKNRRVESFLLNKKGNLIKAGSCEYVLGIHTLAKRAKK
ncbi:MAG: hypothetical protein ACE5GZ_10970 [Gammaproteobacteria bacterium]